MQRQFCEWLNRKDGNKYRLPTDHERNCAVGIGNREFRRQRRRAKDMNIKDAFAWGEQWPPPNDAGNYLGEQCKGPGALSKLKVRHGARKVARGNWRASSSLRRVSSFSALSSSSRAASHCSRVPVLCVVIARLSLPLLQFSDYCDIRLFLFPLEDSEEMAAARL